MKIVYVDKEEFIRILKEHFVLYENGNAMDITDNYFSYEIWFNNLNDLICDSPWDSDEENYKENVKLISKLNLNFDVGALINYKTSEIEAVMYCTDTNFITDDDSYRIFDTIFNNYINERRNKLDYY